MDIKILIYIDYKLDKINLLMNSKKMEKLYKRYLIIKNES